MIVFLKRLIGAEKGQLFEDARFKKNLNGFDNRQRELEDVEDQLVKILDAVEEQQDSIRARPSSIFSNPPLPLGGRNGEESPSQT